MTLRIIPKLEIKNKNLIKGICFEGLRVVGDPKERIKEYIDDLADEIFLIDVVASLYSREIDYNFITNICKNCHIPITISGGIRELSIVDKIFQCGASKISLNSFIFDNEKIIQTIGNIYGQQAVVVNIEVRKIDSDYLVFYNYGRENSNIKIEDWIQRVQENGAGEIILTSIDNDGLQNGFDYKLIEKVSKLIQVPLIFSGGFSSYLDIVKLNKIDNIDIAIASSLHSDEISIFKLKSQLVKENIDVRL